MHGHFALCHRRFSKSGEVNYRVRVGHCCGIIWQPEPVGQAITKLLLTVGGNTLICYINRLRKH